jgi:Cell Wall Hydrolase
MAVRWREAEGIARAALSGFVEPSVGTATHYHADYVLPKWAFQLAKIEQLGRHIFYRFPGSMGKALAFNGRYSSAEHIPQLDYASLQLRADESGMIMPDAQIGTQFVPGLTVEPSASDRHAPADIGGRLDMTKTWRLNIPDPTQASSRYREVLGEVAEGEKEAAASATAMATVPGQPDAHP